MIKQLLITLCLCTGLWAAEGLSSQEFLAAVREPLRQDVWGEVTGRMTYKKNGEDVKNGSLCLRVSFTDTSMYAQIVLNDTNIYGLIQRHNQKDKASIEIDMPPNEIKPGLFEFGLRPDDLSFAFIYWDFVQEMPRQSSRWRECRVMRLANPKGGEFVNVWFDAEHGFPMEAAWYKAGETIPWRTMTLKGAKKYGNGLWFVKEMRLDGSDWKTSVKFDYADINAVGEEGK